MNYEYGLQALEPFAKPEDKDTWRDFKLYEGQLLENLRNEARYGTTETLRSDREVVDLVSRTPGAVGYVSAGTPLSGVKALQLED